MELLLINFQNDSRRFSPYDSAPITSNTVITTADINQYVFLGYSGSTYTITIPAAGDVNDGDWFTFVADGSFSANDANTANLASVTRAKLMQMVLAQSMGRMIKYF